MQKEFPSPGIEKYCGSIHGFLKDFLISQEGGNKSARDVVRMCLRIEDEGGGKITLKPLRSKQIEAEAIAEGVSCRPGEVYSDKTEGRLTEILMHISYFEDVVEKVVGSMREEFAGVLNVNIQEAKFENARFLNCPTIEITLADKPST